MINLLFPRRKETENKWWNRLFFVLLVSTGLWVASVSFVSVMDETSGVWVSSEPIAFSLEPGYQEAAGSEVDCDAGPDSKKVPGDKTATIITCDGIFLVRSDAKRYADLYFAHAKELRQKYDLEKYVQKCAPSSFAPISFLDSVNSCLSRGYSEQREDPNFGIYLADLENTIKLKFEKHIHYDVVLSDIIRSLAAFVAALIIWFLFWSSIVYRIILYVVFGRMKA